MSLIVKIKKQLDNFVLSVDMELTDEIVSVIGMSGSGKSMTLKCIAGIETPDSGFISLNDRVLYDSKNRINLHPGKRRVGYLFQDYLKRFQLPVDKEIKSLSKGMKMKLCIAVALSHKPKLLILDEATSGLDPVMRDDILDVFLDFVQDENHSILMSSHITTDLEKVADYITFIHQGKVLFCKTKDELRYNYGIIRCGAALFDQLDKDEVLAYRKDDYQWNVLVADKEKARRKYKNAVVDDATIDDILLLYVKGEQAK